MNAVEFITDLNGTPILRIPAEAAAQLPKAGKVRVIVLTDDATEDSQWRMAAYEQFLRDDPPEDGVYDSVR